MSCAVAELLRDKGVPVVFATDYGVSGARADLRSAPLLSKHPSLNISAQALLGCSSQLACSTIYRMAIQFPIRIALKAKI